MPGESASHATPSDCCLAAPAVGAEASANRSEIDRRIDALETRLGETRRELAALRRMRKQEIVKDYEFRDWSGRVVHLSALAEGRRDLIVVHNMGVSCAYCTLWADGFVGLLPHLESRASFVVASPDATEVQRRFARERGWNFRMVSAGDNLFFADMGFTDGNGDPMPGVSTFRFEDGLVTRAQRAEFGPGDEFCPVWHFFDLLSDGAGNWEPRYRY